jgi:hypothetical protein
LTGDVAVNSLGAEWDSRRLGVAVSIVGMRDAQGVCLLY